MFNLYMCAKKFFGNRNLVTMHGLDYIGVWGSTEKWNTCGI